MERTLQDFSAGAMNLLMNYDWPGNVRELANLMERLAIMFNEGVVDYDDLPVKYQVEGVSADESFAMPELDEPAVEEAAPHSAPASTTLPADGIDLKEHLAELEKS